MIPQRKRPLFFKSYHIHILTVALNAGIDPCYFTMKFLFHYPTTLPSKQFHDRGDLNEAL